MDELIVKTHDFEEAKLAIKTFSEETTPDLNLTRVEDKKGKKEVIWDWVMCRGFDTNHKVTGEELNNLTSQIQTHLLSINNTQIKLIREFGKVYNALDALDKDYIQAILVSIKATEKTSERIQATQAQIKRIIEDQKKTLEVLNRFKQKLETYAHLEDIDKLWDYCQGCHEDIEAIKAELYYLKNREDDGSMIVQLNRKVQYAYWFAGGAVVLALIALIMMVLK